MTTTFFLNDFELTVDDRAFLVYVHPLKDPSLQTNQKSDLPDWVFSSQNAIWLLESDRTVYEQAIEGDKIKAELFPGLGSSKLC
jgi:hypothetical protein